MIRIINLFFIIFFLLSAKAYSLIEIDITRGNLDPLPIAVSPLFQDDNSKRNSINELKIENVGSEISLVVENNLKISGLFNPLSKEAFLQKPDIAHLKPRFEDWALIKAQALITGKVTIEDKKLKVEFRLWDILAGREMMALAFTTVPNNWRRVGHIISDKVYERLTGEKGYFDTRIIYVSEEGPKTARVKKLAIMDQDGFNTKYLMIENFNPFISLGGDNQKVNHMAEAALEMNLTCNDLKKDLNLTDGDVVDMLQLVMDRFKNSN